MNDDLRYFSKFTIYKYIEYNFEVDGEKRGQKDTFGPQGAKR
jgi:hypothetical protein